VIKSLQAVRGMNDVLPGQIGAWRHLDRVLRGLLRDYGYEELRVPIVEHTELFRRSIGEYTDIVEKEMYSFEDSGGDSLTLRPEATAGIVRAVITNGLLRGARLKLWTAGPMFRHERPQKGRFREFYQFSVEAIGYAGPDVDAELIALGRGCGASSGSRACDCCSIPSAPPRRATATGRRCAVTSRRTRRASMPTAAGACRAIRCASSTARIRRCRP